MSTTVMAKLGVDSKGMDSGLSEAKHKMDRAAKDISKSGERMGGKGGKGPFDGMLGSLTKLGASIFALSKIKDFASSIVDMGGSLVDASDNLGVSIERLQELQQVFGEGGVNAEKFSKGISTLNASIEAAKGGDEDMLQNFAELGITFQDLLQLSPDEILMKVADATSKMGSASEKTVKLAAILGKSSKSMIGVLSQGSDAINEVGASMDKMSETNAKALDKMSDDFDRWWKGVKGATANAALAISESPMAADLKRMTESAGKAMGDFFSKRGISIDQERVAKTKSYLGLDKPQEEAAKEQIDRVAMAQMEANRLMEEAGQKAHKQAMEENEKAETRQHDEGMKRQEELAEFQKETNRKRMSFRQGEKADVKEINFLLEKAAAIQPDIGAGMQLEAEKIKQNLIDRETQRNLMTPAERAAADREERRTQRARTRAERKVERLIREGKIQDAAPGMLPNTPEADMKNAARDLSGAAHTLKGLKIVAITNQ